MQKGKITLLLVTALLIAGTAATEWQGSGNMNYSVKAKIWAHIDADLAAALFFGPQEINKFTKNLSNDLTQSWDQAWNVALTIGPKQYDTILYGYAFNDHWMWFNGLQYPADGNYIVSFIVWKDYNCEAWSNIGDGMNEEVSGFTAEQKAQIEAVAAGLTEEQLTNDIWGAAHGFMDSLAGQSGFSSSQNAYTIIMSQGYQSSYFGYVCRVAGGFYYSYKDNGKPIIEASKLGLYYIFQTR